MGVEILGPTGSSGKNAVSYEEGSGAACAAAAAALRGPVAVAKVRIRVDLRADRVGVVFLLIERKAPALRSSADMVIRRNLGGPLLLQRSAR